MQMQIQHHTQQQQLPHPGGAVPPAPHQVPHSGPAQHYPHPIDLQSPRYSPGMMHHSGSFERESSDDEMRSEQVSNHGWCCHSIKKNKIWTTNKKTVIIPPANFVYGGVYCFTLSIHPSIHVSVSDTLIFC